jgi:hypothetical protein
MPLTQLPPLKPYHPTTFQERGVAVPFTTPLLGGTRARPTERQRVELVIPNPSGGRGVYIMPWAGIASWCRPTLHDTIFNERIAVLLNVTPATIRRVALEIAAECLAGEEAMEAARATAEAEKADRVVTNYRLLMTLVEQVGSRATAPSPGDGANKLDLMSQARLTVDWISPRLGQPATWTASALEALSDVMANIGVGSVGATGRLPRLLAMLHRTRAQIAEWSGSQSEHDQSEYADMICTVADVTLSLARTTLGQAQALSSDMVELLRTWAADPQSVSQRVTRPEWLLDGWEPICLIWNHAEDDAGRRAALAEIVGLVPVFPKEAIDWTDDRTDQDKMIRFRRLVSLNEDWRSGATVFQLIARNEHFRAMTC